MRVALARALFISPDVLLLDERMRPISLCPSRVVRPCTHSASVSSGPHLATNHLDLRAILWLEYFLQRYKKTVVVVSHSREFLNSVCSEIIHLDNRTLMFYKGNYDQFDRQRAEALKTQQRAYEAQQKQIKHIQSFIDRFKYKTKTAALAQSRMRVLEKMEIVPALSEQPVAVCQRLSLSLHSVAHDYLSLCQQLRTRPLHFIFPNPMW